MNGILEYEPKEDKSGPIPKASKGFGFQLHANDKLCMVKAYAEYETFGILTVQSKGEILVF